VEQKRSRSTPSATHHFHVWRLSCIQSLLHRHTGIWSGVADDRFHLNPPPLLAQFASWPGGTKSARGAVRLLARRHEVRAWDLVGATRRTPGMDPRLLLAAAVLAAAVLAAAVLAAAFVVQPGAEGSPDPRPAIASADLLLRAGASRTILHIPRVGWWTAHCGRDHKVAIEFVADHRLPTADVVVSRSAGAKLARRISPGHRVVPEPPLEVASQHWQIAPFASAQVRVTSADVVGRAFQERGSELTCAASVVAVTGPDQGPTREG
jgi:hypothetical protein